MSKETGPISHDEAREILTRYNASHFKGYRDMGETARYSIPADFSRDDDLRMGAYIEQQRAKDSELAALRERVEKLLAAVVNLRKSETPMRLMGPCGANDAGRVLAYRVDAQRMSELNNAAVVVEIALRKAEGEPR